MPHIVTALIGVIIFFTTRKLYRNNIEFFLCLLIIINFEFFSIIPRFSEFGIYREILLPVVCLYLLEYYFLVRIFPQYDGRFFNAGKYGGWVLVFFSILFLGVITATLNGQPLIYGIKATKYYPLFLFYFIIVNQNIDIDKFTTLFVILGCILGLMITTNWLFFDELRLFHFYEDANITRVGGQRNLRITVGSHVIAISTLMAYVKYIDTRYRLHLFIFSGLVLVLIFIIQTRTLLFALIISLVFIHIIHKREFLRRTARYLYFLLLFMSIFAYQFTHNPSSLLKIPILKATFHDLKKNEFNRTRRDNLQIRKEGYKYYLNKIKKSIVTGHGFQNANWIENNERYVQKAYGFYLSDIGWMHFFYKCGLIGIIWLAIGLLLLLKDTFQSPNCKEVGIYFLIGIIMLPTIDLFMSQDHIFIFGIFLGLMSNHIQKKHSVVDET